MALPVRAALLQTVMGPFVIDEVELESPRGTCGLLGLPGRDAAEVTLPMHALLAGRKLVGILEGDADPKTFIPKLVALHAAGRFPLEKLIRCHDFEAINDAVHEMETRTAVKPVLRMQAGGRS
ncbi:hypothetical protein [Corallococcus terminator]|uniref:Alcohol dehydrogenase n=1 Tax=Corallococcus terminator TaxID=2316733 RepID=A0A3A8IZ06_9BACT|nr:hypothetical protein [Corallococcus terminator]RKG84990.1 hypothetical protein D7V88_20740 [Corallococcus terminator]